MSAPPVTRPLILGATFVAEFDALYGEDEAGSDVQGCVAYGEDEQGDVEERFGQNLGDCQCRVRTMLHETKRRILSTVSLELVVFLHRSHIQLTGHDL